MDLSEMSRMCDSKSHRSRSPDDKYAKRSLLSKIDKSELTTLKVSIKKQGVIATAPNLPLERSIDDYAKICSYVHVRKGIPPRVPVFGRGIKVDQVFDSSRTVFHYESGEGTSKQLNRRSVSSERRRSKSRSRSRERSRRRSKSNSTERSRRSLSRQRRTRTSYERSSRKRYRSRNRERSYSRERRNHRESSRDRPRKSRSRSRSPRSMIRHRDRSITPLRPGEYRPGHPDLALRKEKRRIRRSYSRSPKPHDDKIESSRSRERLSSVERSVTRRRRSRSRRRSPVPPPMVMPGMEYGYYEGFPPFGMHPYRPRFPINPMMDPNFYRMSYPHGLMVSGMRMLPPRMARPRFPNYNQGLKSVTSKPATVTSEPEPETATVKELTSVNTDTNESVTSTGVTGSQEDASVSEIVKS